MRGDTNPGGPVSFSVVRAPPCTILRKIGSWEILPLVAFIGTSGELQACCGEEPVAREPPPGVNLSGGCRGLSGVSCGPVQVCGEEIFHGSPVQLPLHAFQDEGISL
jgi:hypothetical protein